MQGKKTGVYVDIDSSRGLRIKVHGETGEWTDYHGVATLKAHGVIYLALSQYFDGCGLEPETVYSCQEVFGPPQVI